MNIQLDRYDRQLLIEALKLLLVDCNEQLTVMHARNNEALACQTFRDAIAKIDLLKVRLT